MSIEVQIKDFNISQFEQLVGLFGSYFKPDDKLLTADYTEWLYGRNPFGLARIVAAVEGNRWIGFMALIPVNFVKRDSQMVAYYVVNVLVHPDFHGKNIFGRMIVAAKELVGAEGSALMGHPNGMALKSWQRAEMNFHDVLKPSLVIPKFRGKGVSTSDLVDLTQLQSILPLLNAQSMQAGRWSLAVSEAYINWRFFGHPTNKYCIQVVSVGAEPAGVLVSRKMRPGVSLLIDQFILDRHVADVFSCLPWLTVTFRPMSSIRENQRSLWALPLKKQLPFFVTHYQQSVTAGDVMNVGLSASDF